MLPCVQAQEGLQLDTAGGQLGLALLCALGLVAEVGPRGAVPAEGVHVGALGTPVGAGVGRAGEVGGQQAVVAGAGLDQPHEAGAKHGGGGDDELEAEGLDRGEGGLEIAAEGVGHLGSRGGDALEEEVVVVRHGGVVEDGGLVGLAGSHESNGLGIFVLELGACTTKNEAY